MSMPISHDASAPASGGSRAHPVWSRAFRPFFLAVGLSGAALVPAWTGIWRGAWPAPAWLGPSLWHGHEMVFGLVAAAIAGFLLTAAPVWTGRPALHGRPLAALVGLWAAGRVAILAAAALPPLLVAALDLAFLPAVAWALARTLHGTGQRHNQGVLALVGALALANAAMHAQALGIAPGVAPRALRFAVDLVVALIVVIGGRITPAFTANALRRRGVTAPLRTRTWLDAAAVACAAGVAAVDAVWPRSPASGVVALAAAVAVAARLSGWQTVRAASDPLVLSLHAGLLWVVIGFLLVAASDLGAPVPASAGLHALSAGAMGAMILAVVTRVSLGHTGRPLELPRFAAGSYLLVHAGAAMRVAAALAPAGAQAALLVVAGVLWASAFALFSVLYAPILLRPRADGKPG